MVIFVLIFDVNISIKWWLFVAEAGIFLPLLQLQTDKNYIINCSSIINNLIPYSAYAYHNKFMAWKLHQRAGEGKGGKRRRKRREKKGKFVNFYKKNQKNYQKTNNWCSFRVLKKHYANHSVDIELVLEGRREGSFLCLFFPITKDYVASGRTIRNHSSASRVHRNSKQLIVI